MAMKDLKSDIQTKIALNTQLINSDITTNGVIIDTKGFESVTFIHHSATITLGTFTPLIQDGDDSGLSDVAAVADDFLVGTEAGAAFVATDDNKTKRIGYVGKKRYVRYNEVSASSADGTVGVIVVLGSAKTLPLAQDS